MKTLRYLLIAMVIGLASASVQAQVKQGKQSDKTEYQFHSTSSQANGSSTSSEMGKRTTSTLMGDGSISPLMTSGSRLPIAARNGVIVGSTSPDDNSLTGGVGPVVRRIGGNTSGGSDDREDPLYTPIGDGMWVLMVLATVFCGVIYLRRKRMTNVKELKS